MVRAIVGDITKIKDVEAITNAANGLGIMGAGVAGAIANAGGDRLRKDARSTCIKAGLFDAGSCYRTESGMLRRNGIIWVYHAVTMKNPGGFTSLDIVGNAINNVLKKAMQDGITSIAIPAMGTGIGGLDKKLVANKMARVIEPYINQLQITVIDINEVFIDHFKKALKTELIENSNEKEQEQQCGRQERDVSTDSCFE